MSMYVFKLSHLNIDYCFDSLYLGNKQGNEVVKYKDSHVVGLEKK